jgi:L-amino acid N-acyltransferase YncA
MAGIRPLDPGDIPAFVAHSDEHARESGVGDTVRFGFRRPGEAPDAERIRRFLEGGLTANVGQPGWCRVWIAEDDGAIRGHAGLRAHGQKEAAHRALVSVGVLAPHRRRGLASALLRAAIDWARSTGTLDWLDSEIFGHNQPALALHRGLGFVEAGRVRDMYRLDGESVDDVRMTLRLRPSP